MNFSQNRKRPTTKGQTHSKICLRGKPQLSRQTGSVSQNQVCQSKHNIHFCDLLLHPSVSRLSETKLQLNHSKNMFNFGAYRGFLMLTAFDLCLGACGVILTLAGTAIDFIVDGLIDFVLLQSFWSFLRSEIAAISIDFFLISSKKFRGHRNIILYHFLRLFALCGIALYPMAVYYCTYHTIFS